MSAPAQHTQEQASAPGVISEAARSTKRNPIVFMDIAIGDQDIGRIKFELFADTCPKTAENFRMFCTGEYRCDSKLM